LRREEENYVGDIKGLGTWPEIAGIKEERKRKKLSLKISLRC